MPNTTKTRNQLVAENHALLAENHDLQVENRALKAELAQRKALQADHDPHDQRPIVGGEHGWMA